MTLRIISSEDILFEGEVNAVRLPGAKGEFTVLNRHAALVSTLVRGSVVYLLSDDSESKIDIDGGIAKVEDNVVSVCIY